MFRVADGRDECRIESWLVGTGFVCCDTGTVNCEDVYAASFFGSRLVVSGEGSEACWWIE